jgi:hypothetical protein
MENNVLHTLSIVTVVCCCMMTSLAMTSNKFVKMMSPTGAPVCSIEPPSQALSMHPRAVKLCGSKCSVSDTCTYFQLNSSSASSGQCQLYNTLPVNLMNIEQCVGFAYSLSKHCVIIPRTGKRQRLIIHTFQAQQIISIHCVIDKSEVYITRVIEL